MSAARTRVEDPPELVDDPLVRARRHRASSEGMRERDRPPADQLGARPEKGVLEAGIRIVAQLVREALERALDLSVDRVFVEADLIRSLEPKLRIPPAGAESEAAHRLLPSHPDGAHHVHGPFVLGKELLLACLVVAKESAHVRGDAGKRVARDRRRDKEPTSTTLRERSKERDP